MLRDTWKLSSEEPGIELATFRLPADLVYLPSHMPPQAAALELPHMGWEDASAITRARRTH